MLKPDAIEIHPCVVVGNDNVGNAIMEQCEEGDPNISTWGLYAHIEGKGLIHIEDFDTKSEAKRAAGLLELFMEVMESPIGDV